MRFRVGTLVLAVPGASFFLSRRSASAVSLAAAGGVLAGRPKCRGRGDLGAPRPVSPV